MAAVEEKPSPSHTNVLTIQRQTPSQQPSQQSLDVLAPLGEIDSTHSLSPPRTAHSEKSAIIAQSSPFDSKQEIVNTKSCLAVDLEAGLSQTATQASSDKILKKKCDGGDNPWPGPQDLKRQRKAAKRGRACCVCWGGLGKRQKLTIKIVSGVIIVAVIVVMCILISKAVGGGVWNKGQSNAPIKGT